MCIARRCWSLRSACHSLKSHNKAPGRNVSKHAKCQMITKFIKHVESLRLCLHDSRVESRVVFTRGGLESSQTNSVHTPFSYHPYTIFEKGSCKVHDESFQPGLNCLRALFSFFHPGLKSQPALSTRVEISTQVVM